MTDEEKRLCYADLGLLTEKTYRQLKRYAANHEVGKSVKDWPSRIAQGNNLDYRGMAINVWGNVWDHQQGKPDSYCLCTFMLERLTAYNAQEVDMASVRGSNSYYRVWGIGMSDLCRSQWKEIMRGLDAPTPSEEKKPSRFSRFKNRFKGSFSGKHQALKSKEHFAGPFYTVDHWE